MGTVTYQLRVKTGSHIVSMMVGSTWSLTYFLRVATSSNMVSIMVVSRSRL